MTLPPRLVLLPGLGADARLLAAQRAAFPQLEVPAWIPPLQRESLRAYAERLARTIRADEPMVLGGVSIGGMIAAEMARHLPVRRVILIASCLHPRAVNPLLRLSERVVRPIPTAVVERFMFLAPVFVGRGGSIPREGRRLLARMAQEIPPDFIRWGARAILEWPGCTDVGVPVDHVHAGHDWVLSVRRVKPDRVIANGCHVLNLSHPAEVNAFIAESLKRGELALSVPA